VSENTKAEDIDKSEGFSAKHDPVKHKKRIRITKKKRKIIKSSRKKNRR